MLTLKDLDLHIVETLEKHHEHVEKKIKSLQHFENEKTKRYAELTKFLPSLLGSLFKLGLGVERMTCFKTGMAPNLNAWEDGDRLSVNFRLKPISNKFKFLSFRGYTASGAGKNDSKLQEKARKIENQILVETGLKVSINHYSLEVKEPKTKETKTILMDLWID